VTLSAPPTTRSLLLVNNTAQCASRALLIGLFAKKAPPRTLTESEKANNERTAPNNLVLWIRMVLLAFLFIYFGQLDARKTQCGKPFARVLSAKTKKRLNRKRGSKCRRAKCTSTKQLVTHASSVLTGKNVKQLYAEGGETAATLAYQRGWARLAVLQELALGVVTTKIGGNESLQFTVKPGTYQWPAMVRRAKV